VAKDQSISRHTLSTLDLNERPGQRVWHVRWVRHYQTDGALELRPGERVFAAGPHHDYYSVMVEIEARIERQADRREAGGREP
jgi:hypothetical protein